MCRNQRYNNHSYKAILRELTVIAQAGHSNNVGSNKLKNSRGGWELLDHFPRISHFDVVPGGPVLVAQSSPLVFSLLSWF